MSKRLDNEHAIFDLCLVNLCLGQFTTQQSVRRPQVANYHLTLERLFYASNTHQILQNLPR